MGKTGRRRMHDYELIARLMREEPSLEVSPKRLAERYTQEHPEHLPISTYTMRSILQSYAREMLGRPRRQRLARPRYHDYEALRRLIAEDPALARSPSRLAPAYEQATGKSIPVKYLNTLLRRHPWVASVEEAES